MLKEHFRHINSYLRYKCKKLSFIARTGLKYDRGTREYFKGCECNKETFYTYVLQHFIYDRIIPGATKQKKIKNDQRNKKKIKKKLLHSPGLVYKSMRGMMTNSIDRDQWLNLP
jgi:hypothetical protein